MRVTPSALLTRAACKQGRWSSTIRYGNAANPSPSTRHFASSSAVRSDPFKPSIVNIAEIRRLLPGTTMVKAREALSNCSNDVQTALAWLEKDSAVSGAKKASKVQDREAKEGGIGITIITDGAPDSPSAASDSSVTGGGVTLAAKAGIVELNCETDFVGRNEIFQSLLSDIAHTAALFPTLAMSEGEGSSKGIANASSQELIDIPIPTLLAFPLLSRVPQQQQQQPRTVGDAILDVISRLGERIHLARASALNNVALPHAYAPRRSESESQPSWLVASAFTHGGVSSQASIGESKAVFSGSGKVGSLLLTRFLRPRGQERRDEASLKAMKAMARSLARQAAGMPTTQIQSSDANDELSLYNQSFIMKLSAANLPDQEEQATGGENVQNALTQWGKIWSGGETSEAVSVLQLRRWGLGEGASDSNS